MTWDEIILKGNEFMSALYLELEKYGRDSNYEDSDIRWLLLGVDDMLGDMGRKSKCD